MSLTLFICEICGAGFGCYSKRRVTCSFACKAAMMRRDKAWTLGRVLDFITVDGNECWLCPDRVIRPDGYGFMGNQLAHRRVWKLVKGEIPAGLQLDHLCRVRRCCNPAHLEPVTQRENLLRGEGFAGRKGRQTECVNGHLFSAENTRIRTNGTRQCKHCNRDQARRYARAKALTR